MRTGVNIWNYLSIEDIKNQASESRDVGVHNIEPQNIKGLHQLHKHTGPFLAKYTQAEQTTIHLVHLHLINVVISKNTFKL